MAFQNRKLCSNPALLFDIFVQLKDLYNPPPPPRVFWWLYVYTDIIIVSTFHFF